MFVCGTRFGNAYIRFDFTFVLLFLHVSTRSIRSGGSDAFLNDFISCPSIFRAFCGFRLWFACIPSESSGLGEILGSLAILDLILIISPVNSLDFQVNCPVHLHCFHFRLDLVIRGPDLTAQTCLLHGPMRMYHFRPFFGWVSLVFRLFVDFRRFFLNYFCKFLTWYDPPGFFIISVDFFWQFVVKLTSGSTET